MNLNVLKKSRRAPQAGDIFAMMPPDGLYLYGRVIKINADAGFGVGANLIYVYRLRAKAKTPVPYLSTGELLVPPMMTNRLPWIRGYFEFLEFREIEPQDLLQQHCFTNSYGRFFDEYGGNLPGPIEPVGQWGLHSFRTIDDEISKALGIPLASDP